VKKINRALAYIKYLLRSFHLHGIHSPFIFQLQEEIIKEKIPFYAFDEIESIRAKLLLTEKKIKVDDLGAGSTYGSGNERSINSIVEQSTKSPKYAQIIFRLAHHFKPKTILEFGTSLGLTTAYLGKACPAAKIISMEGAAEISKVAEVNLNKLNVHNVKLQVGSFESELPIALEELEQLDMVFFDGNHRKEPTLEYFEKCLAKADKNSIFIFDDIYWSKEMSEAWEEIKANPKVKQSIDIFQMGMVFFREDQAEEHFTVYH
jgi:predicted O-methyltransferase YrrM